MAKNLTQPNVLPAIREGLNKTQIGQLAEQSVENVLEDQSNVFLVAEAIAAMEEFARQVRRDERFVELLRDEIIKHNGRVTTPSGAKLEICEAGVSYDYSADTGWSSLEREIQELTERKKALEEKLRRIAPGHVWVDQETGEVLEGPMKASKSTYRITLAK
jgi:hypothetical protein